MKVMLYKNLLFVFFLILILAGCRKNDNLKRSVSTNTGGPPAPPPSVPVPGTIACPERPLIQARLVPVGTLSTPRSNMLCAAAGNKILFVDGDKPTGTWWNDPSIVDIYDLTTNTSSVAQIFGGFRTGAAIATVGNKIFFAGGGDAVGDLQTQRVDIYDALNNSWSVANLSVARQGISAATLGNKVFFAGGAGYVNSPTMWGFFNIVDIYDNSTGTWTTAQLSQARANISATSSNDKVFFAGGHTDGGVSNVVDIYDGATDSWSSTIMSEPRTRMASIVSDNRIFWAGGFSSFSNNTVNYSTTIEVKDLSAGSSTFQCLMPRAGFDAVKSNGNLVFFTGDYSNDYLAGTRFEIYNTTTGIWSTGVLPQRLFRSSIIAVNNTIYVAGGIIGPGQYSSQVWKLEF